MRGGVRVGYGYLRRMFTIKARASGRLFARSSRTDRAPETVFDSPLQESIALLRGLASQMEAGRQLQEAQTVRRVMQLLYAPQLQGARSLKELMDAGDVQVDQELIDWLVEMEWLPEGARASASNRSSKLESASSGRPPPLTLSGSSVQSTVDGGASMKERMTAAALPSASSGTRGVSSFNTSVRSCTSIEEEAAGAHGAMRQQPQQQLSASNLSDRHQAAVWSNAALPRVATEQRHTAPDWARASHPP